MQPSRPRLAYVDTSATLAVALEEPAAPSVAEHLSAFPRLLSSNLLEAEMRAAHHREGLVFDVRIVSNIRWVHPVRSLGREMAKALGAGGYLKGADLWHIATALYIDENVAGRMAFITLDDRQRAVAANLGFET